MMEEPSVWDYIKSTLSFRRKERIVLPSADPQGDVQDEGWETGGTERQIQMDAVDASDSGFAKPDGDIPEWLVAVPQEEEEPYPQVVGGRIPWRILLSVLLAVAAQFVLEPPSRPAGTALALYLLSAGLLIWAVLDGEWVMAMLKPGQAEAPSVTVRGSIYFILPLMIVSFLMFGGNRFTALNLFVWGATVAFLMWVLWVRKDDEGPTLWMRLRRFFRHPILQVRMTWFALALLAVIGLVVFFRFHQLNEVPGEMFSDHAEKLWDVMDVLNGQTSIFFPRNTGREAFQMYLTAAIAKFLGFGISFMSLKLGTVLAGVFTLPFIYLLGKELGNRWVGLLALLLCGVAYWPNVISRIGLRFPLYPLFTAPVLFYIFRGLRTSNRNDFVWAGFWLGAGLHGYSPMRIIPFVIVLMFGIYLLHGQARGKRTQTVVMLMVLAFVSFVVFLPLFRYMLSDPQMFGYRAFSRLGDTEQALNGSPLVIFAGNWFKASIMFFWDNGQIWVHSIPGRPALDFVTGALYFIGVVLLLVRYARQRHWADINLLLLVPLLMLPSILSLAFPDENPSLNRSGAAIVPVFIIAALGMESVIHSLLQHLRGGMGKAGVIMLAGALLLVSITQNYSLVFDRFKTQFLAGAWNTSEIGGVIRAFAESTGNRDTAYVVPYPHWVDTRLVGINAGYPEKDYALWPENFELTLPEGRAKLFILKVDDTANLDLLQQLYPDGKRMYHASEYPFEGKDFWLFSVPATISAEPEEGMEIPGE